VVQEHQCQQAMDLGLVGHQLRQRAPEPDRLRRQVAAAAPALVEDQVHDGQSGGEPVREQMRRRHAERDAGRLDLALGPHEPLRHRRLRNEEGARDLRRGQAAERAQRERHLGIRGQRRVAAGEDELEALVGEGRLVHRVLHGLRNVELARLLGQHALAPQAVDRPVARRGDQPRPRVGRRTVARPALRGRGERVLRGLLGEVEVAEEADQRGQDATPLVAEDVVELGHHSWVGRISTAPPSRAAGMRAASAIAASRSSAS
jgi:hypothetical protein